MTVFLPLDGSVQVPAQPSFVVQSTDVQAQLIKAIQAIMKAKRIVVICGAGISVQAGIPDFRSSEGLFQSIKRDNPKEAMSSGKELFDASIFNSENKTALFCQMIAQLSDLSQAAQPTAFHNVLRALDDRGRLLRVYTQNIDAIEQKCGLSFGVPEFEDRRAKSRAKGKAKAASQEVAGTSVEGSAPADDAMPTQQPVASSSRLPSPPVETPRCIPLHGTLQTMHCQVCNHSFPLLEYLPSLASGLPPPCPECTALETARQLVGKRPRGVGKLRPSVVLYNEAHKDGEGVGNVVQKDLIGSSKGKGKSGADLLLVVGTSLKVPGTKRMVREFAKAVKSRWISTPSKEETGSTPQHALRSSGLATPAPSPRRSPTAEEEHPPPKAIYLNLDFPVPTREWEGVFDAWVQGDAQQFADVLQAEIDKETKAKEVASEKKRKREEEAAMSSKDELPDIGREKEKSNGKSAKRKSVVEKKQGNPQILATPKRRKTLDNELPTPPYSPPSPLRRASPRPSSSPEDGIDIPKRDHSRLYLRIPALQRRPYSIPEVYMTSRAPHFMRRWQRNITPPYLPAHHHVQDYSSSRPHDDHPSSSAYVSKSSTSPGQLNKRTKAGRRALKEAREARRAERLAHSVDPPMHIPPPPPPSRSYIPHLRYYHQESFIRSSALREHRQDNDHDAGVEMKSFPSELLSRTSRLGICEHTPA